jgi:hypothetical protein
MGSSSFRWAAFRAALFLVLSLSHGAEAQEKVRTCVVVDPGTPDASAFERLVATEVDRHPSHMVVTKDCATHLKVELIEIGNERFLTARVGGEVPDRVQVDGRDAAALGRALTELLAVVLGTDPIILKAPGGQSWFMDRALELKDHARGTFDVAFLEGANLVRGKPAFQPGLLISYSREVTSFQIGLEALAMQGLVSHPGVVGLDTQLRFDAVVSYFFSRDADTSGFAGAALGIEVQRFTGPRAADAGGGTGAFGATAPVLGLRGGVEFFRTTTTRAFAMLDVSIPLLPANDQEEEVVKGWFPTVALGAGVRF